MNSRVTVFLFFLQLLLVEPSDIFRNYYTYDLSHGLLQSKINDFNCNNQGLIIELVTLVLITSSCVSL